MVILGSVEEIYVVANEYILYKAQGHELAIIILMSQ